MIESLCACGSSLDYENCCGGYHSNLQKAETTEALMRSRYCAYVLHNADYLLKTWDSNTRPTGIDFSDSAPIWKTLQIINTKKGSPSDTTGVVEFKAFYEQNGNLYVMHELSRFKKIAGNWRYINGTIKFMGKTTLSN